MRLAAEDARDAFDRRFFDDIGYFKFVNDTPLVVSAPQARSSGGRWDRERRQMEAGEGASLRCTAEVAFVGQTPPKGWTCDYPDQDGEPFQGRHHSGQGHHKAIVTNCQPGRFNHSVALSAERVGMYATKRPSRRDRRFL